MKKAILHRKNALFYKTQNGADVGDIFVSLIYTAELNGESPFDYLVALQRHHEAVATAPADWMPSPTGKPPHAWKSRRRRQRIRLHRSPRPPTSGQEFQARLPEGHD